MNPETIVSGEMSSSHADESRTISIGFRGEEDSPLPRWRITLCDRKHPHHPSYAAIDLRWNTRDDGKWGERNAFKKHIQLPLEPEEIGSLIDTATTLRSLFPSEYLLDGIHSHGGHSPTLTVLDSTLCLCITLILNDEWKLVGYIPETSPLWTEHPWGQRICELAGPYLTAIPRQNLKHGFP